MRRVVVTGMGMVTPLGRDLETTWKALLEGKSGVGPISLFDAHTFPTRIAAEVPDFRLDSCTLRILRADGTSIPAIVSLPWPPRAWRCAIPACSNRGPRSIAAVSTEFMQGQGKASMISPGS